MNDVSGKGFWRRLALAPRFAVVVLVRGYQFLLSPFFGQQCRFHPTCSSYAIEALQRFGLLRGGWLTVRRLVRCQPWCDGGVDPVPLQDHEADPGRC